MPDLSSHDQLWLNMHSNIRCDIRKAKKQNVVVEQSSNIDDLLNLVEKTFHRQNLKSPYKRSYVRAIYEAALKHNSAGIFLARGSDGRLHAGNLIVWDENSAYYLLGGGNPELRNSGATSLAMWHAITHCSTITNRFDFEGSMNPRIEKFVRAFGSEQIPSFVISKISSKLFSTYQSLKNIVRLWI